MRALTRRLDAARRDDRGAALVTVLTVIVICSLLAVAILISTVSAVSVTTGGKAMVEARAAAEAGLAEAVLALRTDTCVDGVVASTPGTLPEYRYEVFTGGTAGCPSGSGEVVVRAVGVAQQPSDSPLGGEYTLEAGFVISSSFGTGSAVFIGSGGSLGSFSVTVAEGQTVSGDLQIAEGNLNCNNASNIQGDVYVANGNIDLTNTCNVAGDVYASGKISLNSNIKVGGDVVSLTNDVSLTNNVKVFGDVYAAGRVTFSANVEVGNTSPAEGPVQRGSVYAAGAGLTNAMSNTTVRIHGDWVVGGRIQGFQGKVDGDVIAVGDISDIYKAWVGGNLWAGGAIPTLGEAFVGGDATSASGTGTTQVPPTTRVLGNLKVRGALSGWNCTAVSGYACLTAWSGSKSALQNVKDTGMAGRDAGKVVEVGVTGLPVPSAPTIPAAPPAPSWVDWHYDQADWSAAGLSNVITVPAGSPSCGAIYASSAASPGLQYALSQPVGTVYDARACSEVRFGNGAATDVLLYADVMIVGRTFHVPGITFKSGDGQPHRLWLMVEDGAPGTAGPQTPAGGCGNITVGAGARTYFTDDIQLMAYTPCTIQINSQTQWRGQLYSNKLALSLGEGLVYVPTGIPGTDLGGGTPEDSPGVLSPMQYVRRVAG
ncbi:MAG TPA: hypothetical protein VNQ48_07605 [Microbacteriaceae bacterium]|nr:hypothetical protein [Microbacteriaceae bacterium]